jgi:hypothetical protein
MSSMRDTEGDVGPPRHQRTKSRSHTERKTVGREAGQVLEVSDVILRTVTTAGPQDLGP